MQRSLLAFTLVILGTAHAQAQEVAWRQDYSASRQEASKAGRPLLYNFSTAWCGYCRKLDATTFRDPRVAKLLRDDFVPVKLDGERETRLVQELRIEVYPTLILSDAAGRILGRYTGYLDAEQMMQILEQAKAVTLANAHAARRAAANALLHQARLDAEAGLDLACLQRCLVLVRDHGDLPEADAARTLIRTLKGDAPRLAQIHEQMLTLHAELTLARAEMLVARGAQAEAVAMLEKALLCAGTGPVAELLLVRLQDLRTPSGPTPAAPAVRQWAIDKQP